MENTLKSENTCQKVKRDAFTMPINDHQLIQQIVQDALSFRMNINKSEVVRAGLQLLGYEHHSCKKGSQGTDSLRDSIT